MRVADLGKVRLHYRDDGPRDGAPVVFLNSTGCDLRQWDKVVDRLPEGMRVIRFDMRGHGLSSCPPAPYSMGTLVKDAETLLDHLNVRDCVLVGLSIGGMVAQGLAVKRLDQVRALVLSNTAVRLGMPSIWAERIDAVRKGGTAAIAEGTMAAWFPQKFRATPEFSAWQSMFLRQPAEAIEGFLSAISGTDFISTTSTLTLPTLVIAGSDDGVTPPDLVRELSGYIKGARFELIRGAGHVPCIDQPDAYAGVLNAFLADIAHA